MGWNPLIELGSAVQTNGTTSFLAGERVPFCGETLPLKGVYVLGEDMVETVSITPISGRDSVIEMVEHSFLLDVDQRDMLSHHFRQLLELAKELPFFRLDYPRRYEELPNVRTAVMKHSRVE